jgi:SAM-dependent methyltransferase
VKRVTDENINTPAYWNDVYVGEIKSGRSRVDDRRFGQLRRWFLIRRSELGRPPSVLDVGCGHGEALQRLRQLSPDSLLRGVDISPLAVRHGNVSARQARDKRLEFSLGSAEAIPYPASRFDLVWCGETLEHTTDPERAVGELIRVTGNQGLIVVSVPYRHRNSSDEHLWEFDPADVCQWGARAGELLFLDCRLLTGWLTMLAVLRKQEPEPPEPEKEETDAA